MDLSGYSSVYKLCLLLLWSVECISISRFIVRLQFYPPLLYSSLRVISFSSPRDRRSPLIIIFVTRLGLAHWNRRPRLAQSLGVATRIRYRRSHIYAHPIPSSAAYRNHTTIDACSQTSTWPLDIGRPQEVTNC